MSVELKKLVECLVREQLFLEGVMDFETGEITKLIVNELKNKYNLGTKNNQKKINKPSTWTISWFLQKQEMTFYVVIKTAIGTKFSVVSGGYRAFKTKTGDFRDEINLEIEVPRQTTVEHGKLLPEFINELKSVVRHELEHLQQQVRGGQTSLGVSQDNWVNQSSETGLMDYYSSPDEVESYVMQFYRAAKSQKTSMNDQMNAFIKKSVIPLLLRQNKPLEAQKKFLLKLKKTWVDYASKRLPGVV